jgi:hypothetical protein
MDGERLSYMRASELIIRDYRTTGSVAHGSGSVTVDSIAHGNPANSILESRPSG